MNKKVWLVIFALFFAGIQGKADFSSGGFEEVQFEDTTGKLDAVEANLLDSKKYEIQSLLKEIDKTAAQIMERNHERFSDDLQKGEASIASAKASQLNIRAYELVRQLDARPDISIDELDSTIVDLLRVIRELNKIKY